MVAGKITNELCRIMGICERVDIYIYMSVCLYLYVLKNYKMEVLLVINHSIILVVP